MKITGAPRPVGRRPLLKLGYAYEAAGSQQAIGYLVEALQIFRHLHPPSSAAS